MLSSICLLMLSHLYMHAQALKGGKMPSPPEKKSAVNVPVMPACTILISRVSTDDTHTHRKSANGEASHTRGPAVIQMRLQLCAPLRVAVAVSQLNPFVCHLVTVRVTATAAARESAMSAACFLQLPRG